MFYGYWKYYVSFPKLSTLILPLLHSAHCSKCLQQKLAQMLSRITKIAEEFNVAVYMTNQGKLMQLNIIS